MKRIRIVLVLLCGLMSPFSAQGAEGLLEGADSGAQNVLKEVEGDAVSGVSVEFDQASQKALAAVADKSEAAITAVQEFESKVAGELEEVEGAGVAGKLNKVQVKAADDTIERAAEKEDTAIEQVAGEAGATIIAARAEGAGEEVSAELDAVLKNEGLSSKQVEEFDAAAKEADTTIVAGQPKVKPEEPASAQPTPAGVSGANQVALVNGLVDTLAQKTEALGDRAVSIEDGSESGLGDESSLEDAEKEDDSGTEGPEYAEESQEPSAFSKWNAARIARKKGELADIERLSGDINEKSTQLQFLEADVARSRLVIKEESVEIPQSGFRVGSKNIGQTRALAKLFKDTIGESVEFGGDDVEVTVADETSTFQETQQVLTVKVKLKGYTADEPDQWLTFKIEKPSTAEKSIFEEHKAFQGKFILGRNGRLSFTSDDESLVEQCVAGVKGDAEKIETLKSEITQLQVSRGKLENLFNTSWRLTKNAGSAIKAALKDPKKTISAAGRGTVKGAKAGWSGLKTGVVKVGNGVLEIVKMMMTGVFFGVPSMIYQTLMQQAAAKALYEQITSVYHITPDFAVQIPASLISPGNAAQAGTYLYVAVDPSTSGYGNDMSSAFLENASYYVVYPGPGQQWGSIPATSPQAVAWVGLGTAEVFMDGGIPYTEQTPFSYLMQPTNDATVQAAKGAQTTLSVQQYTQEAFDAVGNRANYSYTEGFADSVAPWNIATQSYDHSVTPNATLQEMFAPVKGSATAGTEKAKKGSSKYAPKLLVRTLNMFRNGIQNVPGFVPGSKVSPPHISLKQCGGNGIFNRLLGSQTSADAVSQSIQLVTTLSSTVSKMDSGSNVIQAVADAQAALKQALSDASSTDYGNKVEAASAVLKNAQAEFQAALSIQGSATNPGLDPSVDVNAYNIYLYETEDTPIVQFMKQNRFSDLIPAKDYVLFLDANYNIVPLFSTAVITRPDGVAVLDFDTSQINQNIQYLVSLVTGTAYLYSASGPGTVMPSLNNMPAAQYIASTVMPTLFQQIALVLDTSGAQNLINQILSMANYATNLSYQGPVVKNGCLFEKIPLEVSSQEAAATAQNLLDDALNGVILPKKNVSAYKTLFGSAVSASSSQLDSMYVYKVSKMMQGGKQQVGVFGTNAAGQPLYDYVVPVASITNADGTPGLQMMPLGLTDAAGTAASGMSGVQMMVSLVTGQVYDNNYCLMTNATADVIERSADFNPLVAQPGQDSRVTPYTQLDGTVVNVNGAMIKNMSLATAFMPTFCNPFNITYGSLFSNPEYKADSAALNAAQIVVQNALNVVVNDIGKAENPTYALEVWQYIQSNPTLQVLAGVFASKTYGPKLGLTGEPEGTLRGHLQTWINANMAVIPFQNAFRLKVQALQSILKPPYNPVKKAIGQMLVMCPMYWMHYAKFALAGQSTNGQSANAQTISYTNASQQPMTATINWIATGASSSTTPVGGSLGQVLPMTTLLDIVNAYDGWQEMVNSTNGVAQVMQSGPFQFSHNERYNVYFTLPSSNGDLNLATGNFFYNMVPVVSPSSLFVMGNLDPAMAQLINTSLNQQKPTSGLTASLTIDQCNAGDLLGHSYLALLDENPVAIDISSGDVWFPTPLGYSATCCNTAQGNIANAQCNVFKIGTVDAEKVLEVALANQGTTKARLQIDNPGLYSMLMSCQSLAVQKDLLAFTAYFAGSSLSLCQEQITHGTYIYAVNVSPENYYDATDYWVATDAQGNPQGILTPQTPCMVSLVTGNVYYMNYSSIQQTTQSTAQDITVGTGVATIETPLTLFQRMFGLGSYSVIPTLLTPVASNNLKLFNIIESLNNLQNQNFLQSQFSSAANTTILAGQIPLTALQSATPVSALYSTLYLVKGKYYLAMPGTAGTPTYYYDFNAELQDVVPSSTGGTPTYAPIPGDAQRGMYYMVEGTGSTAVATPVSALTGYGCQAMRMRFGIAVDKNGNETMGLPVYNPPLPMAANDVTLKPGESGDNMKCLTSAANIASNAGVTDTYTYYQYTNTACESYLTRCFLNTNIPVYNQATKTVTTVPEYQDYYVDLVTGECYSPDGTPRLSQITVAYNFAGNASTGIVANSAFDFSNPLFVWGELDLLGESLQGYMMYQDTNADPSSGYNQYQVQPYSTSFTLYNGGTPTVYAYTVDVTGNIQITQNGNPMSPQQTSMSSVLVNALNGGASLATKSYTMNINGVIPSGTPAAGATVTVTETYATPKQYMISYTDAAGDLITDMFQTPVTSGVGTAPGASTNIYNNPPLDASLQGQLLQAKPFCARVFASCPYGQETVQNINTTIANATTQQKELALGTTGITCGLLYQPPSAATFTLPSAGLLTAIFSGANPNGSTGATNGQYFAFYDSYNNGVGTSSNVVPSKGNYGTYTSIVSSMNNNYLTAGYPGLYAGNFNVEFPASAGSVATTYGAPYLRIMPLTGTLNSSLATAYTVPPTSGTEYLYKYQYDIVPNALLAQLKSTLNISGNVAGFMQLVSALEYGTLAGVSASNPSFNESAAAAISNQVFHGTPLNALTQEPKGRYVYKLACASGGADAASTAPTNGLCQMFYTPGVTNPDTYIDIFNGIVFQSKTTLTNQQLLYPIGFSISHEQRNALSQMIGGAVPVQGSLDFTIKTPVITTNSKGISVGQGAPLPGQVVKGVVQTTN
jgi:hypothetical protein